MMGTLNQINLFFPKLLLVRVLFTATERQRGQSLSHFFLPCDFTGQGKWPLTLQSDCVKNPRSATVRFCDVHKLTSLCLSLMLCMGSEIKHHSEHIQTHTCASFYLSLCILQQQHWPSCQSVARTVSFDPSVFGISDPTGILKNPSISCGSMLCKGIFSLCVSGCSVFELNFARDLGKKVTLRNDIRGPRFNLQLCAL